MSRDSRGWHSRGYLPHYDQPYTTQHITFRLHDAVPTKLVDDWKHQLGLLAQGSESQPTDSNQRLHRLRRRISRYEDEGHGACWLARPEIAAIVKTALMHGAGERYTLREWCIMPNHVHSLIQTNEDFLLRKIVSGWKSFTAKKMNQILNRSGRVWFPEYHDRFMRNTDHIERTVEYIRLNPVRAGLCTRAEEWKFSSAYTDSA